MSKKCPTCGSKLVAGRCKKCEMEKERQESASAFAEAYRKGIEKEKKAMTQIPPGVLLSVVVVAILLIVFVIDL